MSSQPVGGHLLERQTPLTHLTAALERAAEGDGRAVAVVGAAGLGKTSLLRVVREHADGFQVLSARPSEMEQHIPFGAVHQLFDPVMFGSTAAGGLFEGAASLAAPLFDPAHLAERLTAAPDRRSADPRIALGVELFPSLHGLSWLTANLARTRPVLVVLDDAQWADRASLAFVDLLVRRCEGMRVAVVVGTRPPDDQSHPELLQLLADPALHRIVLEPLSSVSVQSLVDRGFDSSPHRDFVDACLAETGGNPFLLTELIREVRSQRLTPNAAAARSVGTLAPDGVSAAIAARLSRMTPEATAAAEAVAVLGDGVGFAAAATQAGLTEDALRRAMRSLMQAGLLQVGAGAISFVHPLMRNTVLARLDPVQREDAHRRAVDLLVLAGHSDATLAAHLHQVSPSGSQRVVDILRGAARAARAVGDPTSAVRHLRRAVEEPPRDDLAGVLVELGQAEAIEGLVEAEEHLRRAVALSEGDARGEAVLALANALKFRGAAVESVELLQRELDALPAPMVARGRVEIAATRISSVGARQLLGTEPLSLVAPWVDDVTTERVWGAFRSFDLAATGGSREEALALASRALAVRPLPLDPFEAPGLATLSAGVACNWLGATTLAETTFQAMLGAARDAGSPVAVSTTSSMLALIAWRRGNVADCAEIAQESIDQAAELGSTPLLLSAALGARAQAASEQVLDTQELRWWERRLTTAQLDPDETPRAEMIHARGDLHVALGDWARAADLYLEAGRAYLGWGGTSPAVKPWRSDAALVLHRLGRVDEAHRLAEEEVDLAERSECSAAVAVALTVFAAVGSPTPEDDLERAAALLTAESASRLDLARNRLELGRQHRRKGRLSDARSILQAALELAVRCGALRTAAAIREELAAAGARPRRVAVTGQDALTVAERRVVEVAAQGRSNREIAQELFVSEKTVETHLGHAYAKLGIRSRTGLAAALGLAAVES